MRRTSISLAIIALLLCGRNLGQAAGQPGAVAPVPQAGQPAQPTPEMIFPGPNSAAPTAVPPAPTTVPQAVTTPQPGTPQPMEIPQGEASVLNSQPAVDSYPVAEGHNSWAQTMPGAAEDQSCAFNGCALCGAGTACPKGWYLDQRVRIMTHPRPRKKVFGSWFTTQSIPTTSGNVSVDVYTPATSSQSLPFDLSSCYEFTVGHYLGLDTHNRDHFLEFTFYGTNHWGASGAVRASDDLRGILEVEDEEVTEWATFGNITSDPTTWAGFNRADYQESEYNAWLNNFEVNLQIRPRAEADRLVLHKNGKWRRQCQERIFCNWLAGVRLFSMGERYRFNSSSTIEYYRIADPDVPYRTENPTASYNTRTYNTLLGLQIGPDWTYRKCRAEAGMGVKAAAYINFAKQESLIRISGAAGDEFSNKENMYFEGAYTRNTSAASIEMDFHAAYKVRPNFILRADYELLYIAGLALAPEQVHMGLDQSLKISTGGALLFQSATLGAEIVW